MTATADFGHTFKIVGLFDKNGDAITNYRFDSGIRIRSVPEPGSMTLLGLGAAILGVAVFGCGSDVWAWAWPEVASCERPA